MTQGLHLSREERALYNPAFTAVVTCRAVQGYQAEYQQACPLIVAVTASVLALQRPIRLLLPSTTRSGLIKWIEDNPSVRFQMGQNATAFAAVVRPGVLLALQQRALEYDSTGRLTAGGQGIKKSISSGTQETMAIQKAAVLLGRWLPSSGSVGTVLSLLGVRP